eukprot:Gregarina_sp_Poly_1__8672@NODE_516_length_7810_cov_96_902622_g410_i0_p3_GENE_NODE_516_length_7810_cov_96_902622_g410_i0NODE_516_length_7810_cov_96_902622_g410_i0_p3_ORF_typecomplete_len434_score53_35Herpes_gI/PF01688_17/1e02Herpes_gI/PF01688_17/3_6_NODE_516_length_7810_cov_96_902622_g410_i023123613
MPLNKSSAKISLNSAPLLLKSPAKKSCHVIDVVDSSSDSDCQIISEEAFEANSNAINSGTPQLGPKQRTFQSLSVSSSSHRTTGKFSAMDSFPRTAPSELSSFDIVSNSIVLPYATGLSIGGSNVYSGLSSVIGDEKIVHVHKHIIRPSEDATTVSHAKRAYLQTSSTSGCRERRQSAFSGCVKSPDRSGVRDRESQLSDTSEPRSRPSWNPSGQRRPRRQRLNRDFSDETFQLDVSPGISISDSGEFVSVSTERRRGRYLSSSSIEDRRDLSISAQRRRSSVSDRTATSAFGSMSSRSRRSSSPRSASSRNSSLRGSFSGGYQTRCAPSWENEIPEQGGNDTTWRVFLGSRNARKFWLTRPERKHPAPRLLKRQFLISMMDLDQTAFRRSIQTDVFEIRILEGLEDLVFPPPRQALPSQKTEQTDSALCLLS